MNTYNTSNKQSEPVPVFATPSIVILGMLFICSLITSNILVLKITHLDLNQFSFISKWLPLDIHTSCGIITFPFTYLISDILTEVYGFRTSRLVIWGGLLCQLITSSFIMLSIGMPASPLWEHQEAYETIMSSSFRIFIASVSAYFVGELFNAYIMSKMKVQTKGRFLWLRSSTSTFVGNILDTAIFFYIAYPMLASLELWKIIVIELGIKMLFEFLFLPVVYYVSGYLKKKDRIDVYDTNTKFKILPQFS